MSRVKKSCSISQWLKSHDKKLYEAVENACALGLFRATKTSGLTFLYPETSSLKNKMIDLLNYNDYEGVRMLQSLIVIDFLPSTSDWQSKKDDIPNRLGIKIEVKDVTNKEVKLGNGAVIKPIEPKKFTAREDRSNMSVWEYKGNNLPMEGPKTDYKYTKKGAPPHKVKGGLFNKGVSPYGLAKACQGKAAGLIASGKYDKCNPFVDVLVSYLDYLKKNNNRAYNAHLHCISYCPEATFYNVFQPFYKDTDPASFSDWLDDTQGITLSGSPATKYLEHLKYAAQQSGSHRKNTSHKRQDVYKKLFPSALRKTLNDLYRDDYVKAQKDEILFMFIERLNDLGGLKGVRDSRIFTEMCFEVEIMQRSGSDKGRYITSTDISSVNDHIDPVGFYSSAALFALSDCFMYAPYVIGNTEQQNELGSTETGHSLKVVDVQKIDVGDLTSDNVLVITQKLADDRLKLLAKNQDSSNPQSAIAKVLGNLSPSDMNSDLKKCIKDLSAKLGGDEEKEVYVDELIMDELGD